MSADMKSYWASSLVLVLLVAAWHPAKAMRACQVDLFRLPQRVQPYNYQVDLWLNPESVKFSGQVTIELIIHQMDTKEFLLSRSIGQTVPALARSPRNIILNAEFLEVTDVKFQQLEGPISKPDICHDATNKILVVKLRDEPILEKDTSLKLKFSGEIREENKGLFRTQATEGNFILSTYFEPAHARRLFPCFDEPEFKATFQLIVVHPRGTTALSNMRSDWYGDTQDGTVITTFEKTPPISSYLFSLAVGRFDTAEEESLKDGMKITIYSPYGRAEDARDMLKKAVQAYDKAKEFFGESEKPLKKIDILAVEGGHGAVENLGLITMYPSLLFAREELVKPNDWNYAVTSLMNVMVRLWLGNLVTMHWWDEQWLLEGLASYLARELTTELHPEISSKMFTLIDTIASSINDEDAQNWRLPIKNERLRTAYEIQASYNWITDKKSEALFRMLSKAVGEANFKAGILKFVRENKYGLVNSIDWWLDLMSYTPPKYTEMISKAPMWFQQAGYPIIIVSLEKGTTVVLRQESRLGNGKYWSIPVRYEINFSPHGSSKHQGDTILYNLMRHRIQLEPGVSLRADHSWLKLNLDYEGYYRIWYDTASLRKGIIRAAERNDLKPADLLQLISDFYSQGKQSNSIRYFLSLLGAIARSGVIDDGVILMLTRVLTDMIEKEPLMASSAMVNDMLMNYYREKGSLSEEASGSNVLNRYVRGEVLHYLVNRLKNQIVIGEARQFMRSTGGRAPPFLEHVLNNLPPEN